MAARASQADDSTLLSLAFLSHSAAIVVHPGRVTFTPFTVIHRGEKKQTSCAHCSVGLIPHLRKDFTLNHHHTSTGDIWNAHMIHAHYSRQSRTVLGFFSLSSKQDFRLVNEIVIRIDIFGCYYNEVMINVSHASIFFY